ncbi:hypothetical protein SAMN05216272_12214 [Pseudomonas panipatensis]|uniref:Uncharacterized protein n=1 Tax=Pseudomonas panipatensis TaxID=428992 RepID=A0A1G8N8V8_9PSED|nr:hypothetical protein SAMN05216272_12214 [Pseudomonas panipatensis]SMP80126.1 hypothetical protein SAMN06295951_1251 [Pseudomonas panipatensis]
MEFCLNPPAEWIGPVIKSRFVRVGGRKKLESDSYVVNPDWRPFSTTLAKRERKLTAERPYRMSQGSVAQVFAVCGSFFQQAMDEGESVLEITVEILDGNDLEPDGRLHQSVTGLQTPLCGEHGVSSAGHEHAWLRERFPPYEFSLYLGMPSIQNAKLILGFRKLMQIRRSAPDRSARCGMQRLFSSWQVPAALPDRNPDRTSI